jgi:murein peptide amidase A
MGHVLSTLVAFLVAAGAGLALGAGGHGPREFGDSVQDRDLRAINVGGRDPSHRVLVVGSIHGDERGGHEVIRRLRRQRPATDAALLTVKSLNPDGIAARRRTNAHGVDLNRNFPYRWRPSEPPGSGYYQGPEPASEPETRAAMRLIRNVDPDVTIWLHQPWGQVPAPCRGSAKPEKLYARIARMRMNRCRGQRLPGTATSWQEHRVGGTAFVVELHAGELGDAEVRRHARAVVRVANRFGSKPLGEGWDSGPWPAAPRAAPGPPAGR